MTDREWLADELESGTGDLSLSWRSAHATDRLAAILSTLAQHERLLAENIQQASTIESLTDALVRCRQAGGK